jgi:hypothetical protein
VKEERYGMARLWTGSSGISIKESDIRMIRCKNKVKCKKSRMYE